MVEPFQRTGIEGDIAICRECLVDGDTEAATLDELWAVRERYLDAESTDDGLKYRNHAVPEFEKIMSAGPGDEVILWFEYELFCQVNYWFCLSLLKDSGAEVFRVAPLIRDPGDLWKGFACLEDDELVRSFARRIALDGRDIDLGSSLWRAFRSRDLRGLSELGTNESEAFPHLREVCAAAAEIETRPRASLRKIMENGEKDFGIIFRAFSQSEGIYGFGDMQVRRLVDELS